MTQGAGKGEKGDTEPRPNFLIFMTDQQRTDHLGCYGNPLLHTPHIDSLAADGVVFERFYTNAPVCMPNRAALATGRMPSVAGVRMNGVPLPHHMITYAEVMRTAGYRTALMGKAHFQTMTDAAPTPVAREPAVPRSYQAERDLRDTDVYGDEAPDNWDRASFAPNVPYYGFEDTQLCLEHGDAVGGAYARWLEQKAPALAAQRHDLSSTQGIAAPQGAPTLIPEDLYPTRFIADAAADWLADHARRFGRDRPFLLHCSFPDPHHPFNPPGKYWSMYDPEDVVLPASFTASSALAPPHKRAIHQELLEGRRKTGGSRVIAVREEEARQAIALNYGAITMIDDAIGDVMSALKSSGLDDNTIVVFLSDHGDFMGDHGLLFKGPLHYQSIIRMPVIIRNSRQHRKAGRSTALACAMDLCPTLLDLAGLDIPHGVQGQSLDPILHDPALASWPDRAILIEEQSHRDIPGLPPPWRVRTLVWERWRLSIFAGASWGELYDLESDPDEINNLYADPAHAGVRAQLLEKLAMEMIMLSPNLPLPMRMA